MTWDYKFTDIDMYNKLTLDEQLDILNKNYPIGSYLHYKPNLLSREEDYDKYICQVYEHVIRRGYNWNWYMIQVKNINPATINLRRGLIIEVIHPSLFIPHISFFRDKKLNNILT